MPFDREPNQNACSSQNTNSRVDMSDSKFIEKKDCSEEFFDSGVISETISSSELYSEADIANEPSISEDNISGADLVDDKKTKEVKSGTNSSVDMKAGTEIMSLDSGFIDVSDSCAKLESEEDKVSNQKPSIEQPQLWQKLYAQDDDGNTWLHHAILNKNEMWIKYLVFNAPAAELLDIKNYYAQTCLHLSVLTNQPKITRFLLLAGANPRVDDKNGNNPLHLASENNNLKCVEALCDEVSSFDRNYYRFKYIPEIISAQDYINEINYDGLSCLHIAANKQLSIFEKLTRTGADINVKEFKKGCTVLHEAVACGNTELVKYILTHPYVELEERNYSRQTAYQLSGKYSEIAKMLLDKCASELEFVEYISEDDYSDDSDSDEEYSFPRNDSSYNFSNARSAVVV